MIPVEKLRSVTHIVSHENCADGMASAMILKHALPNAKVTFLQYDTPAHKALAPAPGMLFCDFAPYKERVAEFREAGTLVLDHHKTQKAVVESFGELGVFADETTEPGVCGAVLAFREVWLPLMKNGYDDGIMPVTVSDATVQQLQTFAILAGIRDTWQRKDARWQSACEQAEALGFWPVEELVELHPDAWGQKFALGPVLYARRLRSAGNCLDRSFNFMTGKGRRVKVFEGLRQSSDAAELAGDTADFVVGFGYTAEANMPKVIYSTRSHTGFDCSAFALAHGGGGHSAAAGFSMSIGPSTVQPYQLLQETLALYERFEEPWLKLVAEHKQDKSFEPIGAYDELRQSAT